MKNGRIICSLLTPVMLIVWCFAPVRALAATPEEMLRRADEIRLPSSAYTMLARVTSYKPNSEPKIGIYEVMSKGKDRSVMKTLAPEFEKDRLLLMRDNNLWGYLPTVSKPLRISLRERLMGEVANVDITRANFYGDYNAVVERTEKIGEKTYTVLNLSAKDDSLSYSKILFWVENDTYRPLKAEFYGLSGRILKSCTYERYATLGGRDRPTRVVMNDPLVKGQYSVIEYAKMTVADLPDKYFTDDYMKKLAAK